MDDHRTASLKERGRVNGSSRMPCCDCGRGGEGSVVWARASDAVLSSVVVFNIDQDAAASAHGILRARSDPTSDVPSPSHKNRLTDTTALTSPTPSEMPIRRACGARLASFGAHVRCAVSAQPGSERRGGSQPAVAMSARGTAIHRAKAADVAQRVSMSCS
jgi:hypothetical protein